MHDVARRVKHKLSCCLLLQKINIAHEVTDFPANTDAKKPKKDHFNVLIFTIFYIFWGVNLG